MRTLLLLLLAGGLIALGYRQMQKPEVTMTPAKESQADAMKLFPDLRKPESAFNKAFLELVEAKKRSDPKTFATFDWPLRLARETGEKLGVAPVPLPPPAPAPAPKPAFSPKTFSTVHSLDPKR